MEALLPVAVDKIRGIVRILDNVIGTHLRLLAQPDYRALALRFGPELTRRLDQAYGRDAVALPVEPVAVMVRVVVAAALGVPDRTPVAPLRPIPGGTTPEVTA